MTREAADRELLRSWRDGDRNAGSELFARHFMTIYRFFVNKVDRGVDDLLQRTFTACAEARDRMAEDSNVRAYLLGIARRQLLVHFRELRREPAAIDEAVVSVADLVDSPSQLAADGEERGLLARALRRLPLDIQTTLELHYWEDLQLGEIAVILEVPVGTIKSRLSRGRAMLRETIERLDAPLALRQSTLAGLDTWARQLRAASQVAGDD